MTTWVVGEFAYHLRDAETMVEVVERHFVIVHVDFAEELAEHGQLDGELGGELQVGVHVLEQQQDLLVFPLPVVERRHPQALADLVRQGQVAAEGKGQWTGYFC